MQILVSPIQKKSLQSLLKQVLKKVSITKPVSLH